MFVSLNGVCVVQSSLQPHLRKMLQCKFEQCASCRCQTAYLQPTSEDTSHQATFSCSNSPAQLPPVVSRIASWRFPPFAQFSRITMCLHSTLLSVPQLHSTLLSVPQFDSTLLSMPQIPCHAAQHCIMLTHCLLTTIYDTTSPPTLP